METKAALKVWVLPTATGSCTLSVSSDSNIIDYPLHSAGQLLVSHRQPRVTLEEGTSVDELLRSSLPVAVSVRACLDGRLLSRTWPVMGGIISR